LVAEFEKLIYKEVQILRQDFLYSTYSKAHNRYDIFAPGRFEEYKDSFISPNDLIKYLPPPDFLILKDGALVIDDSDVKENAVKLKWS